MPALTAFALIVLLAIGGCRADAAPGDDDAPKVSLQGFRPVPGTPILTSNLGSAASNRRSSISSDSYDSEPGRLVNVLFFDTEAREGRWLFPSNEVRIVGRRELSPDSGAVKAIVFTVIARDTNEDERLTEEDDKSLVVVAPDGSGRRTLVERFDAHLGDFEVSPEAVVFTYSVRGQPAAVELSLADLSSREIDLPKVPGSGV